MIILLTDSQENHIAANALRIADNEQIVVNNWQFANIPKTEKTLTLLDILADSPFEPQKLAQSLIDKQFATTQITTIHLLVSDLKPASPILGLATELCHAIIHHIPERELKVIVPNDLNSPTLIVPPATNARDWKLYGVAGNYWSLQPTATDSKGRLNNYQHTLTREIFNSDVATLLKNPTYSVESSTVKQQYDPNEELGYLSFHK